mgnify:CR=1 FL=1
MVVPFSLAVISAVGSKEEACSDFNSHPAPVGLDPASLESWCVAFLMQGLSLSTHRTSAKAQCSSGVLSAPGQAPSVRITVWNLCLFAIFLTQSIHHRNIKVYLSCIRDSMWSRGLQIPLRTICVYNREIWGGSNNLRVCCPPLDHHLQIAYIIMLIWQSLNMDCPDHCMFWTACTLGYFGFLYLAEFTVPSLASFSALLHLHPHWSGCLSPLCSSSHDNVSCAVGQCPRPPLYALRLSRTASCTSH